MIHVESLGRKISVKDCLDQAGLVGAGVGLDCYLSVTWDGKIHPECGQHHILGRALNSVRMRKVS